MSALTVPFLMPRVEEVVPDFAMLKDRLTGSSVVEERYTATQVPSSGDSYAVGGSGTKLMIIRVANQNDYIDTSTMVLNFRAVGADLSGAPTSQATDCAIDDHIFSLVDTINVKVGGQTVEVLNNVGHLINALVQGSMPLAYYKQNGGFEGLYAYDKWSDVAGVRVGATALVSGRPFHDSGGAVAPATAAPTLGLDLCPGSAPDTTGSAMMDARWDIGNRWLIKGRYYSVPLTLLGLCRIPTLFAARNFQDVTIEILFRSNLLGAVWSRTPATPSAWATTAGAQINISDVTLTYDCCRMSADYYALMDQELKMPNGSGVAYPIDTYQVQPATIPSTVSTTAVGLETYAQGGLTRIVVAKGTRFLKGVYGVSKAQVAESSSLWRNNSSAGNFAFSSYQVIINSKRYPQLQIQSSAQAFQELQKAYNQLGSVAGGALTSWYTYVGQPWARSNGGVALSTATSILPQDRVAAGTKDGSNLGVYAGDEAMFQLGVNLEQFLSSQPDAGGINTSTSGYQIAIEVNQNGAVGDVAAGTIVGQTLTHYVILHFTRVLTLKAGAVEVLD